MGRGIIGFLLCVLFVGVVQYTARADPPVLTSIIKPGDPVRITGIGDSEVFKAIRTFQEAILNDDGRVAFHGSLLLECTIGPCDGFIHPFNDDGYWMSQSNPVGVYDWSPIVREGHPAYASSEIHIGADGSVGLLNGDGIWAGPLGAISQVHATGDPAPESGGTFTFSNGGGANLTMAPTGVPTFQARYSPSYPGLGIWHGAGSLTDAVAYEGGLVPGIPGATFSSINNWNLAGAARAAFIGEFIDPVTSLVQRGVWSGGAGTLGLIARTGDPVPGMAGVNFGNVFLVPVTNAAGHTAFMVNDTASKLGIYSNASGSLEIVARQGEPAPGISGATFLGFDAPSLSESGYAAFCGQVTGHSDGLGNVGVWAQGPSGLRLIARAGAVAPGTGGATFVGGSIGSCPFVKDKRVTINKLGQTAFLGFLQSGSGTPPVDSGNNFGLWMEDPSGNLQLVVRTSDVVGGSTVTSFTVIMERTVHDGLTSSFNNRGQVALRLLTSSGVIGLYLASFEHFIEITAGPEGNPDPVASGADAQFTITAADNLAHDLSYQWRADCSAWSSSNGAFNDATLRNPTWTAPANPGVQTESCEIGITVSEDFGLSSDFTFSQRIRIEGPGNMVVTPTQNVAFEGVIGGPFRSPQNPDCTGLLCIFFPSRTYTVENSGQEAIDYTVNRNRVWIELAPSVDSGTTSAGNLAAGANTDVTVSVNANANNLCVGDYTGTLVFANLTNSNGNTARTVSLTVQPDPNDSAPPVVTPPPDLILEATGALTLITRQILEQNGQATASDDSGVIASGPTPLLPGIPGGGIPGSYGIGTIDVAWDANDCSGKTGRAWQKVTIGDTTGPVVTPPAPITIEATGPLTAITRALLEAVDTATAVDSVDGVIQPQPLIGPNTALPLGTSNVGWIATDSQGNFTIENQIVTVIDTVPPILTIPPDVTVTSDTAPVTIDIGMATAVDVNGVDPNPVVTRNPTITRFPFGTTEIRWKATDASGNSSAEQIQRIAVLSGVSLAGMEVIQVVQDMNNSLPLFEGKKTLVRAYFESSDELLEPIWPKLIGFRGTQQLTEVLTPTNFDQRTITRQNVLSLRANATWPSKIANLAANFELPNSWTQFGVTKLQLTFTDSRNPVISCAGALGSVTEDCELSVRFGFTAPIEVKLFPIGHYDDSDNLQLPSNDDVYNVVKRLVATFPIKSVNVIYGPTVVFHFSLFDFWGVPRKPTSEMVNNNLQEIREDDTCYTFLGCNRIYYGIMSKEWGTEGVPGGSSSGSWETASGIADDEDPGDPVGAGHGVFRFISTHEISHSIKMPHPFFRTFGDGPVGACGAKADADDPRFPYTYLDIPNIPKNVFGSFSDLPVPGAGDGNVAGRAAAIGPLPDFTPCSQCPTFVGDDKVVLGYDSDRERHISPLTNFEMMSYCGPRFNWPSKTTYKAMASRVCDWFEKNCIIYPTGISSTSSEVSATNLSLAPRSIGASSLVPAPPHTLIGGIISKTTMEVRFNLISTLVDPLTTPPPMPVGDYTLQLLDNVGNVLREVSFEPNVDTIHPTPTVKEPDKTFLIPVPFDPNLYEVRIIKDDQVLGSIHASANAPIVDVVYPNGGETLSGDTVAIEWSAGDTDNDEIFFDVSFSPDGGATWQTLAKNHIKTSLMVDMNLLSETSNGLIRVQAKDGFLTGMDTSDGSFSAPNSAPTVVILGPTPYSVFGGTQTINLKATSSDRESGFLGEDGFAWRSNIDGRLGMGADLSVLASTLTPGTHQIAVTGSDSGGGTGTDTVEIVVVGATFPPMILANVATYPNRLWPPNHKMVPVTLAPNVKSMPELDDAECQIISISSNEAEDEKGDGKTRGDWLITGSLTAEVRAERAGGGGAREYAITVQCTANEGEIQHTVTGTGTVIVPEKE